MIKKIQIELSLFILLLISILFSGDFDLWIFNFFTQLNYGPRSIYLKDFFIRITNLGDSLWYFMFFILFQVRLGIDFRFLNVTVAFLWASCQTFGPTFLTWDWIKRNLCGCS